MSEWNKVRNIEFMIRNYQKYESFKIVLEDLYGTRYVKEIVVKDNRRTTVHVAKEDKN